MCLESEQRATASSLTYQLAEQYHMGLPIELYHMQPQWIRFCRVIQSVVLGAVICVALFLLIIIIFFFYQYLIVYAGHIPDLQTRLTLGLPGVISGSIGGIGCLLIRNTITQRVPASLLICTEGLLEIYPKRVVVTRWNEVNGLSRGLKSGKRKVYQLSRIKRKPLIFGEAFENVEDLVNLISQQTQVHAKNSP